jgi:hypothetical protein
MVSHLLICGICLLPSTCLLAQEKTSRDTTPSPPGFVAQKLILKPTGPAFQLGEATKTPDTSSKSILYLGPHAKDTVNLDLPRMRNKNIGFLMQTGKNQPLYWQNLHY